MKVEIQERESSKTHNHYTCLIIHIGAYEKVVFLDKAEEELLKILYSKNN